MTKKSQRIMELTADLAMTEVGKRFESHYVDFEERGKYGTRITCKEPEYIRVEIPYVFRDADKDVTDELFRTVLFHWEHPHAPTYGPLVCTFLKDPKVVSSVRRGVSKSNLFRMFACPRPTLSSASIRFGRQLLKDYDDVLKDTVVRWRAPYISSSKIISADYYAKYIAVDPVLLTDNVRKPLRDYVIFREMCAMCAFSYAHNAVLKWKMKLLLHRFPEWEHMEDMCKRLGWSFQVRL